MSQALTAHDGRRRQAGARGALAPGIVGCFRRELGAAFLRAGAPTRLVELQLACLQAIEGAPPLALGIIDARGDDEALAALALARCEARLERGPFAGDAGTLGVVRARGRDRGRRGCGERE